MVRYKRTARKGALTPAARALIRSLYGAPPPSRVRSIESKEFRVVAPNVISDDEETATPTHSSGNIPQPLNPSAPTADPSPLSTNDIRREINAVLADIAITLKDNKKFY